jgi:phosphonate ABC transporter permease subunit PhnE
LADLDTRPQASKAVGESAPETKPKKRRWPRFVAIVVAIGIAFVVYAYAFDKTDVDLDEIQSETRQTQLVRILRALARPELLTYERVDTNLDAQVMMPCPPGGFTPEAPDTSGPYIVTDPTCVEPGAAVQVSGSNLSANSRGDLFLVTDSGARVRLGDFSTDADGSFATTINTRERPSDEPQTIRAVTAVQVGSIFRWEQVPTGETDPETGEAVTVTSPRLSQTSLDTWDKIIETVFLALIATTVGTVIAVPLSFFAARNLMKDISVTTTGLTLAILGGVIGIALGLVLARAARVASEAMDDNLLLILLGLVVLPAGIVWAVRWALPAEDLEPPSRATRAVRGVVLLGAAVVGIITLYLVAALLGTAGDWLNGRLGPFNFLGIFLVSIGDIVALLIAAVATLIIGGVFMFLGSRLGSALRAHLPSGLVRPLNLVFAAAAGATGAVVLAQLVAWLYEITSPQTTIWIPALIGALLGLLGAALIYRRESAGVGLTGYYMARTTFNGIRAIEPLVMVIVFVVWVGIGPFAGALALALHTTAALAKLYSEQVESIQTGPIEAIKATGATRLQTIVYAVAPQIVPPYISFTMYRWDINVRMSTIIGFAGGGGIGFLLQQNINLLNYRAAAVQMLAIAIVVASMDYVSSRLRERFV